MPLVVAGDNTEVNYTDQQNSTNETFENEDVVVVTTPTKRIDPSFLHSVFDFLVQIGNIISPFLFFDLPWIDINWDTLENLYNKFRDALSRADPSVNTAGAAGLMAIGIGGVIGPYIVQGIKYVLSCIVEFVDNLYFVATGEGLVRKDIPDEVWDDLFQVTIERLVK